MRSHRRGDGHRPLVRAWRSPRARPRPATACPREGTVFFSLADRDKPAGLVAARRFAELGFSLVATAGTAAALEAEGLTVDGVVGKLTVDGERRPGPGRGRAAAVGQGRPGGQHAAGPGSPGRRRPHPAHRHRPGHPVRHHRGRGPGRVGRDRRVGVHRGDRPLAAGVPPRRSAPSRGMNAARRPERRSARRAGSTRACRTRSSPRRAPSATAPRWPAWASRPGSARSPPSRSSPEPWPGKPAPRLHIDRRRDAQRGRPAGPRRRRVARRTTCPRCARPGARVIASVWGHTVDDFAGAAKMLADADADVVAIEVNVSCPNLHRSAIRARSSRTIRPRPSEVVARGRRRDARLPVFAKLSPNVTDLTAIARAAVDAGADGLTLVNTVMGLADRRGDPPAGARRGWRRPLRSGDQTGRVAGGARRSRARSPASR